VTTLVDERTKRELRKTSLEDKQLPDRSFRALPQLRSLPTTYPSSEPRRPQRPSNTRAATDSPMAPALQEHRLNPARI
jgi:hypothetical protein